MKVFDYSDCVLGEYYFFVFDGVVYYGQACNDDFDEDEPPTHFMVEILFETKKEVCNIWNATLIYKL